jgi:chaperonin GroEL (HSP60 family)
MILMNEKSPVVSDNVNRTLGREAQRNNILAARVIADIVKTTLGPKGSIYII